MNKKILIIAALLLGGIVAGSLSYLNSSKINNNLSDQEIKNKYCHVTAEVRKTDVYCQNPDLYRQHLRENNVIEE